MYNVKAVTYNTCGADTAERLINVTKSIKRRGSIYVNGEDLCLGQSLRGSLGAGSAMRAILNYDDGSIDTLSDNYSFKHVYTVNGTYDVTAIFEYFCGEPDTAIKTVTIGTQVFNFSITPYRNSFCPTELVQFNPPWLYLGDTLKFDFGDGTSAQFFDTVGAVSHVYDTAGSYLVKATKSNACGFSNQSQTTVTVASGAMPHLSITADYAGQESPLCQDDTIMLRMSAEQFTLKNAMFTFEDGSSLTGESGKITFTKGQHLIKATAENMCGSKLTGYYTLDVWDTFLNPSLSYYFYPLTQCVNQEFFFDVFANGAQSITWDMGDGNSFDGDVNLPHMMYVYSEAGMYDVNIVAKNGCGKSTATSRLNVASGPSLSFSNTDLNINIGDSVTFTQTATGGGEIYWVFNLNLDDTSSAKVVTRAYPVRGVYTASLFGINDFGCWDTITKTIRVGMVSISNLPSDTERFIVYPNPANNDIKVKVLQGVLDVDVRLFDITGKQHTIQPKQLGKDLYQFDLGKIKTGIYFMRIKQGEHVCNAKIVVTH